MMLINSIPKSKSEKSRVKRNADGDEYEEITDFGSMFGD